MSLTEFMKVSKIVTYSNNVHTYVNTKKNTYKEGLDCFMQIWGSFRFLKDSKSEKNHL